MATPHVAGVAALLIGNGVATTPDQVRSVLQGTARDLGTAGWDAVYGWGLVDACAALGAGAPVNQPPVADAGPDQTSAVGSTVAFDGSGSSDSDGTIVTYEWTFGDGSIGSGISTSHTYATAGTYAVTLTVTDDDGATGTDTATVTVNPASTGGTLHISGINMALKYAGKNVSATATVTIVDRDGTPVAGAVVSGVWSGLTNDSDSGMTGTFGQVTLESNKVKSAKSGTYFTFTVTEVAFGSWTWDEVNAQASVYVP